MATGRLLPTQLQPFVPFLNVFDTEPKPYAFGHLQKPLANVLVI